MRFFFKENVSLIIIRFISYIETSFVIRKKNIGRGFDQNSKSLFGYKLGLWDLKT